MNLVKPYFIGTVLSGLKHRSGFRLWARRKVIVDKQAQHLQKKSPLSHCFLTSFVYYYVIITLNTVVTREKSLDKSTFDSAL